MGPAASSRRRMRISRRPAWGYGSISAGLRAGICRPHITAPGKRISGAISRSLVSAATIAMNRLNDEERTPISVRLSRASACRIGRNEKAPMEKPDYFFYVADPELMGQHGSSHVILRFQSLELKNNRAHRSGKHIHLELTAAIAMKLLGQLEAARKLLGCPFPAVPSHIDVPPQRQRN